MLACHPQVRRLRRRKFVQPHSLLIGGMVGVLLGDQVKRLIRLITRAGGSSSSGSSGGGAKQVEGGAGNEAAAAEQEQQQQAAAAEVTESK